MLFKCNQFPIDMYREKTSSMYVYNFYKIQLQWIKYNFYGCDQGYHEPLRLNLLNKEVFPKLMGL